MHFDLVLVLEILKLGLLFIDVGFDLLLLLDYAFLGCQVFVEFLDLYLELFQGLHQLFSLALDLVQKPLVLLLLLV